MRLLKLFPILFFSLFCTFYASGQNAHSALKISHLTGDFYVYTTYNIYKGEPVPSNSMYLVTNAGVVMFDTPWDPSQLQPLLDSIEKKHHKKVILSISSHFHEDRTGGLDFLREKGVKTYSSQMTYEFCQKRQEKLAEFHFQKDTTFIVGQHTFQTFYGGEGHTKDNIIFWFKKEKILYGGCLIKSVEADDLGNLNDANTSEWPNTLLRIKAKFPKPSYVITGHQDWSSTKSIDHTLHLLKLYRNNKGK
ncbi:metallo-beta-lactamase class B [Pseudarcicella hirudinis]|uniref:beta-lactamase n=1 Tax=Pseudarcicella hirudinis TaxID=1079859 RepID=A0A1I5RT89_9BACT|nr:BlaB/IND/MUS family subclass B1 metallo-beta-lactamase [Pseudarcicella hirudinis]SFP61481.1 metallo-beta-lactamase class B [Pseudarcicella hirudinis]